MIQNIIALTIVFSATGYTIFSVIKSLTAKQTSQCGGCEGCSFKEHLAIKHAKTMQAGKFQPSRLIFLKNGK